MKLEGSLDAFGLPDVLHLLHTTAKTGALHVERGHRSALIYLIDGHIAGATSSATGRLGLLRRLVGQGLVSEEMVGAAAARAAESGAGLVATMTEDGALDPEVARTQTHALTVDTLFDLVRWEDGDFSFAAEELPLDDVGVREAPASIVALAVARGPEWDAAAVHVPAPDHVPLLARGLDGAQTLSEAEWDLLTLINGHRTVQDIVDASGLGSYTLVVRLAGLVERGCVTVWPDAPAASAQLDARNDILALLDAAEGLDPAHTAASVPDEDPAEAGESVATSDERPHSQSTVVTVTESSAAPPASRATARVPETASPSQASPAGPSAMQAPAGTSAGHLLGGAHVAGDVVPPRPEPFLPPRAPEHGEPTGSDHMLGGASEQQMQVIGANAVIAQPAHQESPADEASGAAAGVPLNRSMVLRLIAGVRGL